MVHLVVAQNPGPVEEGVDQAIDGYHVHPHSALIPARVAGQEQARQGHVGKLRADVGNGGDFLDEILETVANGSSGQLVLSKCSTTYP